MKKRRNSFRRCLCLLLSALTMVLGVTASSRFALHAEAANVVRGVNIPYNRYLNGATYSTHMYTVDGRIAYCIESEKSAVANGDYYSAHNLSYSDAPMLTLALYYGYGGDGSWVMRKFFADNYGVDLSEEQQYLYTHIVANYAFVGANMSSTPGQFYKGLNSDIAEAYGINSWIRYIGKVLGGSEDYSGRKVKSGWVTYFDTNSQKIAVVGNVEFENPPETPPTPDVPDTPDRKSVV